MSDEDREGEIQALRDRLAELEPQPPATQQPVPHWLPGAPPRARKSWRFERSSWIILGCAGLGLAMIVSVLAQPSDHAGDQRRPATPSFTDTWHYQESPDSMKGGSIYGACVFASDEVHLESPYVSQSPMFCLRNSHDALEAFMVLPDGGQYLCYSYTGCFVAVRFDGLPVSKHLATEAADGSTNTLFIRDASDLMAHLKNSRAMRIQARYWQQGDQTVTFPVAGFDSTRLHLSPAGRPRGKH